MSPKRSYILTATAEKNIRDAKTWSQRRWGKRLTTNYFSQLHEAMVNLAKEHKTYQTRQELAGDTGLEIYTFRQHYIVFVPIDEERIVIAAVIHQSRDVAPILADERHELTREIAAVRASIRRGYE